MNSRPAAIDAQCVDIQNDRQHKGFIKVTLHLPAELGPLLTNIMGWPTYTTPVPVAIARLNFTPQPTKEEPNQERHTPEVPAPADTRPARSLPQRIGMLCNDVRFQKFLEERFGIEPELAGVIFGRANWAADKVRKICEVTSRAEILPGTKAEQAWNMIESAYLAETRI